MINSSQIRAARAWLQLSQDELAERVGVAARTIMRVESDQSNPQDRTLADIRKALEELGIEFFNDPTGIGIRVPSPRPDRPARKRIPREALSRSSS